MATITEMKKWQSGYAGLAIKQAKHSINAPQNNATALYKKAQGGKHARINDNTNTCNRNYRPGGGKVKTYEVLVTLSDKTVKKLEIDAEAPSTAFRIAKGLFRGVRGLSVRRGGKDAN